MEHSPERAEAADREGDRRRGSAAAVGAVAALDLVGQLAVPGSILALVRGRTDLGVSLSLVATLALSLRAFVVGIAIEAQFRNAWARTVAALRATPLAVLGGRREDRENAGLVLDAVREVASLRASTLPQLAARFVALAAFLVAIVLVVGAGWIVLGLVALVPVVALIATAGRRIRNAQQRAYERTAHMGLDLRVLLEATRELRAHEAERAFAAAFLDQADDLARAERSLASWSSLGGLLPAAIAVVAVQAPARAGVKWIAQTLGGASVVDVGVLGGGTMLLGIGAARGLEALARGAPARRLLAELWSRGTGAVSDGVERAAGPSNLRDVAIELEAVSFVYSAGRDATPCATSFRWEPATSLAVTGDNGAGKSTLALLILGLLEPTAGRIAIDGAPLDAASARWLRSRSAFVPQEPFVAPGSSVRWHMQLFSPAGPASDGELRDALERVGLWQRLAEHAGRHGGDPLAVPAGELSGGERKRLHLARALARGAQLFVVDEPEAGLDTSGRVALRELFAKLAETQRILVIAHDPSVVPESFAHVVCRRGRLAG